MEKWENNFEELKIFRWNQLINCLTWNDIQKSLTFIWQNNKKKPIGMWMKILFSMNIIM